MSRWLVWTNSLLLAGFIVGAPWAYLKYRRANSRNFRVVEHGTIYRSGQLSMDGLKRVIHDHGIRTVITLRDAKEPGEPPPDWKEEEFCRQEELRYFRLPPRRFWKQNGQAPADVNVARFLEISDDPRNAPILIHCWGGTHRTGAFVAIYRMEYQHWTNAEAIAELRAAGYDNLQEQNDISEYLETYQPRWKRTQPEPAAQ